MPNTLQFLQDNDHYRAHSRVQLERHVRSAIVDHWQTYVAFYGPEVAEQILRETNNALRQALQEHRERFHAYQVGT